MLMAVNGVTYQMFHVKAQFCVYGLRFLRKCNLGENAEFSDICHLITVIIAMSL